MGITKQMKKEALNIYTNWKETKVLCDSAREIILKMPILVKWAFVLSRWICPICSVIANVITIGLVGEIIAQSWRKWERLQGTLKYNCFEISNWSSYKLVLLNRDLFSWLLVPDLFCFAFKLKYILVVYIFISSIKLIKEGCLHPNGE